MASDRTSRSRGLNVTKPFWSWSCVNTDPPAATVRMASTSVGSGTVLRRKPAAPNLADAATYCEVLNDEITRTAGFDRGAALGEGLDAVAVLEADVEQHDVDVVANEELPRVGSRGTVGGDDEVVDRREGRIEAARHHRVVVHDREADGHACQTTRMIVPAARTVDRELGVDRLARRRIDARPSRLRFAASRGLRSPRPAPSSLTSSSTHPGATARADPDRRSRQNGGSRCRPPPTQSGTSPARPRSAADAPRRSRCRRRRSARHRQRHDGGLLGQEVEGGGQAEVVEHGGRSSVATFRRWPARARRSSLSASAPGMISSRRITATSSWSGTSWSSRASRARSRSVASAAACSRTSPSSASSIGRRTGRAQPGRRPARERR